MRVLVVGGTGRVGRRVVAELRGAEHEPTVFARDASTVLEGIRTVAGDVRDGDAIRAALDGHDAPGGGLRMDARLPAEHARRGRHRGRTG